MECPTLSYGYNDSGILSSSTSPICTMIDFPKFAPWLSLSIGVTASPQKGDKSMNSQVILQSAVRATLKDVVDRLAVNPTLSGTRKRDLRSAVITYGKLVGEPLSAIPLELVAIRRKLDGIVPAQAKVSRKRWANLRSDLAAALGESGLQPMLKTADVQLDSSWVALLGAVKDKVVRNGLSRLARWATMRQISPAAVDDAILERFFSELEAASLVRNLRGQRRSVAKAWNRLAASLPDQALRRVLVPSNRPASTRVPWLELPASFRDDVEKYLLWCRVPDPLDDKARVRALAPETLRLRRDHIHLAASATCAAGIAPVRLTSLAALVEPETFRALLRHRWEASGRRFSSYTRDLAVALITIASEWVRVPADQLSVLKKYRGKLGSPQPGLTEKNKALLRRFDDPRLLTALTQLPDKLWRTARRNRVPKRWFIDLQTALALDILLYVPLRIENLAALRFDEHLHWPQGRGKPALLIVRLEETKNETPLEFELPTALADRLYVYRHEIAPAVIGRRPDFLFISRRGVRRALSTIRVAIQRSVLRHIGVRLTPHQFRHLAAKIQLDANPGAYELVRQLLVHKDLKTTTKFYAGIDTRRAGRAHAALLNRLREERPERVRRHPTPRQE
jgi:integrase